ncbi:MAG: DUF411 domain-containing protein [Gammaproteobacteria bacterium]|nr:DUF411 domain-containing protein [Gammaproteobacteria bacterium]
MKNLINRPLLAIVAVSLFGAAGIYSAVAGSSNQQVSEVIATDSIIPVTVYKDPNCGCCTGWIEHIDKHGFKSTVVHPQDLYAFKESLSVGTNLRSCHTAVTDNGFVFEGHVPAKYIKQFLNNPPSNALGLTVPGMVVGSPGMEVGDKFRAYQVLVLNRDGSSSVYAEISSYNQQF